MPDANATDNAVQGTQLGRDAVVVHVIALAFAALNLAIVLFLRWNADDTRRTLFFMTQIAAIVIGLWSVVLAFHALLTGEPAQRPMAVLCLFFAGTIIGSDLFSGDVSGFPYFADWYVRSGLAVFVPVLALSNIIALPLARWHVRRERQRDGAGNQQWPWKQTLAWYYRIAALVVAIVLPCPLLLFAVETRSGGLWPEREYGWRSFVIEKTPVAVGEVAAWTTQQWSARSYGRVLDTGRVAERRLVAELDSRDGDVRNKAETGVWRTDPTSALERAERVGNRELITTHDDFLRRAGRAMGRRGNAEAVRRYLDVARTPPPPAPFMDGLFWGMWEVQRREFLPDIERFVEADSSARPSALAFLGAISRPEDVERLWRKHLADSNPARRMECIRATRCIRDADTQLRMLLLELGREDHAPIVEWWPCWRPLVNNEDRAKVNPRLVTQFVERILPLMDSDGGKTRWVAASSMADLTGMLEYPEGSISGRMQEMLGEPPPPEMDHDKAMLDDLRAHVKEWLVRRQ